ncbi:gas vesicle protein GvpJ, partial [Streptomyces althioticus]
MPSPAGPDGAAGPRGGGLVIDAFVRVSLVGIEILKIDVRVVVA